MRLAGENAALKTGYPHWTHWPARLAWSGFWLLLALPFVAGGAGQFEWSWPGMHRLFAGFFAEGFRLIHAWGEFYRTAVLLAGLAVLATRVRRRPAGPAPSRLQLLTFRAVLFALSLGGFAVTVEKIALLTEAVLDRPFIEPPAGDKALEETLMGEFARIAAGTKFDTVIQESLQRGDITHARIHVQAAALLDIELLADTRQAFAEATTWQASLLRGSQEALRGGLTGQSRSLESLAGALAIDLTPVGDVRDIVDQLGFRDQPDDLILGLSVFGLGLTAATFLAPQQAVPARFAKAAFKTALRHARLSPGVAADIRRIGTSVVDLPALRQAARRWDLSSGQASRFVRRQPAAELGRLGADLYQIRQTAGTKAALAVLKQADSLADLPLYRRIARVLGDRTETVVGMLGKSSKRAFRVYRAGTRVRLLIGGWTAALLASLAGLAVSLSGHLTSRLTRLRLRGALAGR